MIIVISFKFGKQVKPLNACLLDLFVYLCDAVYLLIAFGASVGREHAENGRAEHWQRVVKVGQTALLIVVGGFEWDIIRITGFDKFHFGFAAFDTRALKCECAGSNDE